MNRMELALRLLGIGWYVGLCILLGVAGGLWLDKNVTHTTPLLTMVGLFFGLFAAFYGGYRMMLPYINRKRNGGKN